MEPDESRSLENVIRGELHELGINIPRRQKSITRLLREARERLEGLTQMQARQSQLQEQLKKLKMGN